MNDPCKSYKLTFEARPHYLYAHIKAETMTRRTAQIYLREIADECLRLRYRRLLIERDVPMMLSDLDVFGVANDFFDMVKFVRIAVVSPYEDHEDALRFAVLVGTNRGARFAAHPTIWEAEKWLLEGVRVFSREIPRPIFAKPDR